MKREHQEALLAIYCALLNGRGKEFSPYHEFKAEAQMALAAYAAFLKVTNGMATP